MWVKGWSVAFLCCFVVLTAAIEYEFIKYPPQWRGFAEDTRKVIGSGFKKETIRYFVIVFILRNL